MTGPAPPLSIRLFGGLQVIVRGEDRSAAFLPRKCDLLLALLVLHWPRRFHQSVYAERLWEEQAGQEASLRRSLTQLREALGAEKGRLEGGDFPFLDLDGADVDVLRFRRLVQEAGEGRDIDGLKQAADLRAGPLLEKHPRRECLRADCLDLDRAYFDALERIVEATRDAPGLAERRIAEHYLRRHIAADPGRSDRALLLMRLLATRGDTPGALHAFEESAQWLNRNNRRADPEMTDFYRRLLRGDPPPAGPPRSAVSFRHNLRGLPSVTRVGDTSQAAQIRDFLLHTPRQSLWATLKGGPGMGKTLTAQRIAEEIAHDFPAFFDGVWFVPLRHRRSEVARAVAEVMELPVGEGADAAAALCAHLRERSDLLVLDNCQHLLTKETYDFFRRLRRECPRLSVLATSQEAPDLEGARVFPIRRLTDEEAADLFFLRAEEKGAALERAQHTVRLVRAVCRRAGNIPLAIEFASGLLEVRSLEETAGRTGLLNLHPGGESPLQFSLEDAFAALGAESQRLLARLSVFSGWTWEAARQVCCGEEIPPAAFEKAHLQLLRRSLVEIQGGDPTRYDLAEVTREFAGERLTAPERERQRQRHAQFYRTLITRVEGEMEGERQAQLYELLSKERDNLRAAREWLDSRPDDRGESLEIVSLWRFWLASDFIPEVRSWMTEGVRKARNAPIGIQIKFLEARALQAYLRSEFEQAAHFAEEVYQLCQSDPPGGKPRRDLTYVCHALAAIYANLAYRSGTAEHEQRCRRYLQRGMSLAMEADDDHQKALAHLAAGMKQWYDRDFAAARETLEECLRLLDGKKDIGWMCFACNTLGHVLRGLGDPAAARETYRRGFELSRSIRQMRAMGGCVQGLAALAAGDRDFERAALLLGVSDRLYNDLHWKRLPPQVEDYERIARTIRETLGEPVFLERRAAGTRLPLNPAFSLAFGTERGGADSDLRR